MNSVNTNFLKMVSVSNSGHHQYLRRPDRSCGDDHLLSCSKPLCFSKSRHLQTCSSLPIQNYFIHVAERGHGKFVPRELLSKSFERTRPVPIGHCHMGGSKPPVF